MSENVPSPTRSQSGPPAVTTVLHPLLSIKKVAAALDCSRRVFERLRASGRFPKPDLLLGRMPRWRRETVQRWIENGGRA